VGTLCDFMLDPILPTIFP